MGTGAFSESEQDEKQQIRYFEAAIEAYKSYGRLLPIPSVSTLGMMMQWYEGGEYRLREGSPQRQYGPREFFANPFYHFDSRDLAGTVGVVVRTSPDTYGLREPLPHLAIRLGSPRLLSFFVQASDSRPLFTGGGSLSGGIGRIIGKSLYQAGLAMGPQRTPAPFLTMQRTQKSWKVYLGFYAGPGSSSFLPSYGVSIGLGRQWPR